MKSMLFTLALFSFSISAESYFLKNESISKEINNIDPFKMVVLSASSGILKEKIKQGYKIQKVTNPLSGKEIYILIKV